LWPSGTSGGSVGVCLMISVLQKAREKGVSLLLDNGQIRIKFKPGKVDMTLLSALKPYREPLLAHLYWIQGLRRYSPVVTPLGQGVIWELYPCLQRVGVMVEG